MPEHRRFVDLAKKLAMTILERPRLRWLVVPPLLFSVTKQKEDGTVRFCWRPRKGASVLLVLNHEAFRRGDLTTLSRYSTLTILLLNTRLQQLIPHAFYDDGFTAMDYYKVASNHVARKQQKRVRDCIKLVLSVLFAVYRVRAVVTPNVRYVSDLDWAYVSARLDVPEIVFYREGLVMYPRARRGAIERHRLFGKFQGAKILVHNKAMKEVFLESGFANKDQVIVCGALRMDELTIRVKKYDTSSEKRQILWFFFCPGLYQYDTVDEFGTRPAGTPTDLYSKFLNGLLDYLVQDSEATLLIKPKTLSPKGTNYPTRELLYLDLIRHKFTERKYRDLANGRVRIESDIGIYDAIESSRVVCGLQTTALLEAAVFGKRIIIPFFEEFREGSWAERLAYRSYPNSFTLSRDVIDLHKELQTCLNQENEVTAETMLERRRLFEKWISPLSGDIVENYVREIEGVIVEGARRNHRQA